MGCSPPGSSVHRILQVRILEWIVVQSLSRIWLFATPWTAARQASLSITNSRSLLKLSIKSVMPSNHLILCRPLLLLPSISPSIRVFSNESVLCIRWPKYWSFSFSISPSNEYLGLICFRIDWLDLLAVQGTLKSLLQHHSSKASVLRHSAFFIVQLSHPYMTTGKTIALTRQTFVDKVISLLSNMLSRLVIAFLPRDFRLGITVSCWASDRSEVCFASLSAALLPCEIGSEATWWPQQCMIPPAVGMLAAFKSWSISGVLVMGEPLVDRSPHSSCQGSL